MYEETKVKFDWKGFIIKMIILILVIILVIKLLPINKNNTTKANSEAFTSNLTKLKKVGKDFFNKENLPTNNGDSKVISLEELESIGKISTLKDSEGKACSVTKSYIKATKNTNGYNLEVHLVCGDNKDTTYEYLGCFDSCTSTTTKTTTTTKKASGSSSSSSGSKSSSTSGSKSSTGSKSSSSSTTGSKTSYVTVTKATSVKKYAVIFNSNGGSTVSTEHIVKGNRAIRPEDPSKSGYTFLGWYLNGSLYNFNNNVNSNIILIAKWGKSSTKPTTPTETETTENYYTVKFDTNGASSIASKKVASGSTVSKPNDPSRDNAIFLGWYLNGVKYDFNNRVYENITLVAKYRRTVYYTTSVYSASGDVSPQTTVTVNHTLAIPTALNNSKFENVKLISLRYVRSMSTDADITNYMVFYKYTYDNVNINGSSASFPTTYLATIGSANVHKTVSDVYDRRVTWIGNVTRECTTKVNNSCVYGIVYNATWSYEITD